MKRMIGFSIKIKVSVRIYQDSQYIKTCFGKNTYYLKTEKSNLDDKNKVSFGSNLFCRLENMFYDGTTTFSIGYIQVWEITS